MISIWPLRIERLAVGIVVLVACAFAHAEHKVVRLRNEHISTEKKNAARDARPENPHTGLFLIQLTGPVEADWLKQLKDRGASVVQYVPDDAFVARAHGIRVKELEQLPFVRWTGPFRPEHKVLSSLARKRGANADLGVSVLLAPDSTPQQLGAARGLLKKVSSESSLKFGHVWRGILPSSRLDTLAASDAVLWIEPAPNIKLFDEPASKIVAGDGGTHTTTMQALGYDGSGVAVAVADSGLHNW